MGASLGRSERRGQASNSVKHRWRKVRKDLRVHRLKFSVQIKSGQMKKKRRECLIWKREAPDKRGKEKDRDQEETHQLDQRYGL